MKINTWLQSNEDRISLLILGTLVLSCGFVFFPTWQALFHAWLSSDDYSHGFLIVPLSFYLVWRKRDELKALPIKPSWAAFPFVLTSLLLYLLAQFAEIRTLAPLAMILFLGLSLFFLVGQQILKQCLFPLYLLFFMVPVPAQIYAEVTIPLQLFVSKITVTIATLWGIPILREGNVIFLPEHTLQVVQACSGLRSIMSLLLLGSVVGYFGLKSNVLRSVLVLLAVPIAVLVNTVRVLMIVAVFYFFDFDLANEAVHTLFGVVIFSLAVALFILCQKGLALCDA